MDQARTVRGKQSKKPQSTAKSSRKRARVVSDSEDERESKRAKAGEAHESTAEQDDSEESPAAKSTFKQPALLTGATLKDYQLEGVAWMAGLHQNGISGILGTLCEIVYCPTATTDLVGSGRDGPRKSEYGGHS